MTGPARPPARPPVRGGIGLLLRGCEWLAAMLVVVEVALLLAGVVSRYGFDAPLVWSDELAGAVFLWLAMLGAVIALARGEHMRLGAVVALAGPRLAAGLQALAAAVVAVFVLEIVVPAYDYALEQWQITSPALEFPDGLRVAAILVAAVLMLVLAAHRLFAAAGARGGLMAIAVVVALALALFLARPWLVGLGNWNLVLFFVVLVAVAVGIGVPIAFAFGTATLSYLALATHIPLSIVVSRMDSGMTGLVLLAVPLFVFLGLLIEMTGLARALIDFLAALLGHVRGGLSYVLIAAMYLVSGISGSKAADMAAVAPALFPEMRARGADPGRLVALLASSGAMAETIPPSLVLITIGSVTGVSIAGLFDGGLLPALVGAIGLALVVFLQARREPAQHVARAGLGQIGRRFVVALPALALPFMIRAAVVDGIATATEVSTLGVAYAIIMGLFVYRSFDWRRLGAILVETASLSGAILFIIGTATSMGWALTQSGFARALVAAMTGMPGGKAGFLAVSIAAFAVLGSVLEGIPAIILFGPLLFPAARALHVHEVHYAIVVVLAMGLGLFAPPFGVGFYAACAIGRVPPDAAFAKIWPYLAILLVAVVLVAAFPSLAVSG